MERNMSLVYSLMPTDGLRKLRSQKFVRRQKIDRDFGWYANQEKRKLDSQMKQIDAELACREPQIPLL